MTPNIFRHIGFTLTAMTSVVAYVFRRDLLPLPFVALLLTMGALRYITAYLSIRRGLKIVATAVAAIPVAWFFLANDNSRLLWMNLALAVAGSGGILLLVAPWPCRPRTGGN